MLLLAEIISRQFPSYHATVCPNSDNGDGVVVGVCPFLCGNYFYMDIDSGTNLSTLCDGDIRQNRQGQMCGKCKDNHSPSPYSYQLKCANCSHALQVQLA